MNQFEHKNSRMLLGRLTRQTHKMPEKNIEMTTETLFWILLSEELRESAEDENEGEHTPRG